MATSQAKIVANQMNAQKSTGPRTEEGKARSRWNAIRHGMRAEQCAMYDENQAALDLECEQWVDELVKEGTVARRFAEKAFKAYVRSNRCERAEEAEIADLVKQADLNFLAGHFDRIRDLALKFESSPASTVLELRTTPEGCDWLRAHWEELGDCIRERVWGKAHRQKFLNLIGCNFHPENHFETLLDVAEYYMKICGPVLAAGLPTDATPEELSKRLDPQLVADFLTVRETGSNSTNDLFQYILARIEDLKNLAKVVEPDFQERRELAIRKALAGDTPSLARTRRYMAMAESQMHRNAQAAVRESKRQLAELAATPVLEAEPLAESLAESIQPDPIPAQPAPQTPETPPVSAPNEPTVPPPSSDSHPHPTDATEPNGALNPTESHISIFRE